MYLGKEFHAAWNSTRYMHKNESIMHKVGTVSANEYCVT